MAQKLEQIPLLHRTKVAHDCLPVTPVLRDPTPVSLLGLRIHTVYIQTHTRILHIHMVYVNSHRHTQHTQIKKTES